MASSSRVRIRRKRDYGAGAMALTEYKVDRVRSRTASCNGLDRRICDDILEGVDNVATLLICLDYPHIRFSDAGLPGARGWGWAGCQKPPMRMRIGERVPLTSRDEGRSHARRQRDACASLP